MKYEFIVKEKKVVIKPQTQTDCFQLGRLSTKIAKYEVSTGDNELHKFVVEVEHLVRALLTI